MPLLPFAALRRIGPQPLVVPLYHLVTPTGQPAPAHVRALYPVRDERQFEQDLDFLLRHYTPVALADLRAPARSGALGARPSFHLTFDDGLRPCADLIAPLLRRRGIPATFFLNPDFLDNQGLMFRYQAALLATADPSRAAAYLATPYERRSELTAHAAARGLDFAAYLRAERPYMTTDQVRGLLATGFTIGAHSFDHPLYTPLPLAEQVRQTLGSLDALRARFGPGAPAAFAFPFTDDGVSQAFFAAVRAREPDLLTFGTAGLKTDTVPGHWQRVPLEKSSASARTQLTTETLAYLAKRALGRHQVPRT